MYELTTEPPIVYTREREFGAYALVTMAKEPSLFSCDINAVRVMGGPIANKVLGRILRKFDDKIYAAANVDLYPVIDVRVQRLMPGMYPSIPGWHCDAVPRASYFDQPDFEKINPAAFHVCCTLSTHDEGVSNTQFFNKPEKVTIENERRDVYKQLHEQMENRDGKIIVEDGAFVFFTPKTPHRAMPTINRGWRMFFRFSMYHNPPIKNSVPSQQQVYILSEANGW